MVLRLILSCRCGLFSLLYGALAVMLKQLTAKPGALRLDLGDLLGEVGLFDHVLRETRVLVTLP
jgi:hypothetical protein